MNGPWIHQNILESIKNIKAKKNITGGTKVNESDGYCAALPYFLYNKSEKDIKKVVRSVANSKINETYALAKLKIIDLANNGDKNAVKTFVKRYRKNKYFREVIINTKKVIKLRKQNHIKVVRKFGKACSYPERTWDRFMQFSHQKVINQQLSKQLRLEDVIVAELILLELIL